MRIGLLTLSAALLLPAALGAQTPPAKAAAPADRLDRELLQRAEGKVPPDDVRIDANWRRGTEIVSSRVYGTGAGVWREKTQFSLTRDQVLSLLQEIRRERFGAMPAFYGTEEAEGEDEESEKERAKDMEKEREKEKVYLRGSLTVRVGTDVKRVAQYMEGDQNKDFAALVERVLAASEKAAGRGVGTDSLSEGLAAVADGKLAAETLQVFAQRRPGRAGASADRADSWTLRIDGRRVFDVSPAEAAARERVLVLPEADFRSLAALLRESDLAGLPRNLYSPDYVRLEVSVLDRRADLTARRYAGKTATSLGAKQETFDRVYAALLALHQRAQKEGAEAPAAE